MQQKGVEFIDKNYKEQYTAFDEFLQRENLEAIRSLYSQEFWDYYDGNIVGMVYFSCPILYPNYFEDGDLIRTLISDDDTDFPPVFWWFKQHKNGKFERLTPQKFETGDDAWVCICGNTECDDGFYPCNEIGVEVEPVEGIWEEPLYVCYDCGRIIHHDTLEIVGFRQP